MIDHQLNKFLKPILNELAKKLLPKNVNIKLIPRATAHFWH